MPPIIDLACSGGGTRGVALAGAIDVLEQKGFKVRRIVGTSAGAIASIWAAAGRSAREYIDLVPAKEGDPFRFNEFFAPPPPEKVREAIKPKQSETRRLIRAGVDGAIDKSLERLTERRPRIGELIQGAFALGKQPIYEAAFEGFVERLTARPPRPDRDGIANGRRMLAVFALIEFGGFFDPELFRGWLVDQMKVRVPRFGLDTTLKQFHEHSRTLGRELSVVVADTTDAKALVLNHRTAPNCPVVDAVRMSMSVPLVWPEIVWDKTWGRYLDRDIAEHVIVDGGLLNNFPLRFLLEPKSDEVRAVMGDPPAEKGEVIGLLLDKATPVPGDVAPAVAHEFKLFERIERLFDSMSAWQSYTGEGSETATCHIGARGHPALELTNDAAAVARLQVMVNSGRCAMLDHLKTRKLT